MADSRKHCQLRANAAVWAFEGETGDDPEGISHIAPVCRDMAETMRFYVQVLGMALFKTVELPGGGQHFFFDCGGGNAVALFW